jgi:hypothetical protein
MGHLVKIDKNIRAVLPFTYIIAAVLAILYEREADHGTRYLE